MPSVEELPSELDGVADEVHVHFPWGSLLRALAGGEDRVLQNLRRICAPGAWLEVVISLDSRRDRSEITRLGLDPVLTGTMTPSLTASYRAAGFEVIESGVIAQSEWPESARHGRDGFEAGPAARLPILLHAQQKKTQPPGREASKASV